MTEWIVRRWARYGHERLYAQTPGGTALGHLDLKTGRYHSDDMSNLPLLKAAIAAHQAADHRPPAASDGAVESAAVSTPIVAPPMAPDIPNAPPRPLSPATETETWHDLSLTPAGAEARKRALAEREARGWLRHGLARLVDAHTDERAWRLGADGEVAVADQLGKLGPKWHVIHAVPVGQNGSDIDHVVIGPGGVFTVNAKHHPPASVWVGGDTVMVNGQRVPYVRNSGYEARRASRLLAERVGFPVAAVGIIAVMGAQRGFTIKRQPEDGSVVIVQRRRISQHLRALPDRLSTREIDVLFDLARRSTTWQC